MILLARHGETDDNRDPIRIMGSRDVALNENGREQAIALAGRAAEEGAASLWSSPLARARETAEIIGARLALAPTLDARLVETHRGDWEGRTWLEIERDEPDGYAAWRAAGEEFRFPGGESLREQADRVLASLAEITATAPLPALVVCHGGSIRVALCEGDARGLSAFHDWDVPNGTLIAL